MADGMEVSGGVLAFGAHPDDVEFGCGGILAGEAGRAVHIVVCSQGEAGTRGTVEGRVQEAEAGAKMLGASVDFLALDGDGKLAVRVEHAVALARVIRRVRPAVVLAPTTVANQHPDHARLGELVRDACRLARYGGVAELKGLDVHAVGALLFYAVTVEAEVAASVPVLVDVSAHVGTWKAAMEAHGSQMKTRPYVELQLARARVNGLRAGVEYAMAVWPNDAVVVESLGALSRGARRF